MKNIRRTLRVTAAAAAIALLAACGAGGEGSSDGREELELWFWGATPAQRAALEENLVDAYNASQDEYTLTVTFNERVDSNIQTALAANEGPDIVYGSGPSFVSPFAQSGKLLNLDDYSEQYGWQDRLLAPIYESGTVDGSLYAVANSINTVGIFYNQAVLDDLGVGVPTTIEELETALAAAQDAGLYPSVTGNKGWQPVNENYSSMFLTAVAGPDAMHDVLTGAASWTDQPYVDAVQMSADWYENGYLGGGQYTNLNFLESMQLLSDGQSPFFFGPTLAFQFAAEFFNTENGNVDDLGFIPFPTVGAELESPLYTLATTASFSINAQTEHPDAAAEVIDHMLTEDFMSTMTAQWPGYWGVPLAGVELDPAQFDGLSAAYVTALVDILAATEEGRFGYFTGTFFPPQTQQALVDIDTVWTGQADAETFLTGIETTFAAELADGAVPPIPAP
ncbi:ABC transporter substrate-binding protein [Occultella aeris]|uniref:Putative sugar-binding periplasmic protein n=1 Tax=Occultella aeris TaxID=2761496 RepID=A0A7M4DGS3_9MICO|nr:extracellular solute-binding protein [Occultella aeris]VZO36116.1 putative sugar-binding periplasmic protein precursor [Occultella aeris]